MKNKLDCVMLVDDNDDDNFYHQMILRQADIANNIHVSESGFEALDFLTKEKNAPELIFLDINMPAMNGWEFLEGYNKLNAKQKAEVIIIMLTTSLNPADRKRSEQIPGINGFETKPLTQEKLTKILERYFPHDKRGK